MNNPTACIIVIGNEILSGRTKDTNIAYLAKSLNELGIIVSHVRVIPDIESEIINNVNELKKKYTYIFTTGGIGPTHDDITSLAIAKAFSKKLIRHSEAQKILEEHYGDEINESRLTMADIPEDAVLIYNPISKAPGFFIENVHVLPGFPHILQAIFENFKDSLEKGDKIHERSIILHIAESKIANDLTNHQNKWSLVSMGSYPFEKDGSYGTNLVLKSNDEKMLDEAFLELQDIIKDRDIKSKI